MIPSHYPALEASVLVLNKMFMAVHVISVRRAFCLLCKELAEVVSLEGDRFTTYDFTSWRELSAFRDQFFGDEDDDWVRTVNSEIRVPRVIRLLGYDKLPKQTVKFNRRNIFARDLIRGVATSGAALAYQPRDGVSGQRLGFFVVAGAKDPLAKEIATIKDRLAEKKYPVTQREVAEMGKEYLDRKTFEELVRWIDSLDKL